MHAGRGCPALPTPGHLGSPRSLVRRQVANFSTWAHLNRLRIACCEPDPAMSRTGTWRGLGREGWLFPSAPLPSVPAVVPYLKCHFFLWDPLQCLCCVSFSRLTLRLDFLSTHQMCRLPHCTGSQPDHIPATPPRYRKRVAQAPPTALS